MNNICLIGRLTRDPETRTTTGGKNVANFTLAVNRKFKPADDGPTADFFRCVAWNQPAEYVGRYLSKGRLVAVNGRIEQKPWTDKDGNKREGYEVVVDTVNGLDRAKEDDGDGGRKTGRSSSPSVHEEEEYDPFKD